jgi:hypothetical protein
MQWHFLRIHSIHQLLLKCSAADKFSKQKINLSFRGYLYLFFSQLCVPALRNTVCKTGKVTYFKFRQLTCVKLQYHPEGFHCSEQLKYKFTFSLELNAKAIQVCCNIILGKKKRPWLEDLLFSSCNFTGSISRSSLLPSLSERRYLGPFYVDSTTSHPYGRLSPCTQHLPLQERPERSYALAQWIGGGLQWKLPTTLHTQILRRC